MSADASTLALPSSLPIWVRHLPHCTVEVSIEHASLVEEPSTREEHRDQQRPLYSVQRRTLPTVRHSVTPTWSKHTVVSAALAGLLRVPSPSTRAISRRRERSPCYSCSCHFRVLL